MRLDRPFDRADHLHAIVVEAGAGLGLFAPDLLRAGQLAHPGVQRGQLIVEQGRHGAHAGPHFAGIWIAPFPVGLARQRARTSSAFGNTSSTTQ